MGHSYHFSLFNIQLFWCQLWILWSKVSSFFIAILTMLTFKEHLKGLLKVFFSEKLNSETFNAFIYFHCWDWNPGPGVSKADTYHWAEGPHPVVLRPSHGIAQIDLKLTMLLCQLRTWVGSNMPCLLDSSRSCTELFAHFSGEEILGYLNRWFVINSSANTSLSFCYLVISNGAAKKTFGPFNGWEQFCSASISWGCCMAEMIRWHVFSSWWLAQHISFHSPQQCMEVPSVLRPEHSILFLCYFLSFSHL